MNRRHTIGESVESIDRVVYHKNSSSSRRTHDQAQQQTDQHLKPGSNISNGRVAKSKLFSFSGLTTAIFYFENMFRHDKLKFT